MIVYKKVFYDTNPLIYYLEQNDDYLGKMKRFITEQTEADSDFVTSTITVGEYLTGPYKNHDERLIEDFKGFKLMDSLQLATAKYSGCDAFVSNDLQLRQFEGLDILIVDEFPSDDDIND